MIDQNESENLAQQFQFASMEYKELCQNVRESWSYITALIRQYLLIQIVLLSIVGLGSSAVPTTRGVVYGKSQTSPETNTTNQTQDFPNVVNDRSLDYDREIRFRKYARVSSTIALILIGAGLSWGAYFQSNRLFVNAKNFVQRAASIEKNYGVGKLASGNGKTSPTHIYMLSRLNNQELFQMSKGLTFVYFCGVLVWTVISVILLVPFIA